jgi:hypothetical protein
MAIGVSFPEFRLLDQLATLVFGNYLERTIMLRPILQGHHIPLVEAAHFGGRQKPSAILIRTSWTTGDRGAANAIAQAWHNPYNRVDSCHYVVDDAQTLRCLPDKVVAFPGFPEHKGAISINVCHDPPELPTFLTLRRAVILTARLCKLYDFPVRLFDKADEERWLKHKWWYRGGIILKTAGDFPADKFLASVKRERNNIDRKDYYEP